jgi:hypothetical protein
MATYTVWVTARGWFEVEANGEDEAGELAEYEVTEGAPDVQRWGEYEIVNIEAD